MRDHQRTGDPMKNSGMLRTIAVVLASVTMLVACSGKPVRFGPMTGAHYDASRGRQITAERCGLQLLHLFPVRINNRLFTAHQRLLREADRDYVTDIKVRESWSYALIGTVYCTSMEATAYPRLP